MAFKGHNKTSKKLLHSPERRSSRDDKQIAGHFDANHRNGNLHISHDS